LEAFGVILGTKERQGEFCEGPGHAWQEVFPNRDQNHVSIRIRSKTAEEELASLVIFEGNPHEYDGRVDFTLPVPLRWQGASTPHTRQRGADNADVILVDANFHLHDIQVGLVSRQGRCFLTAQKIFQGWIRITQEETRFIPSSPTHAYPGMDYKNVWADMGQVLGTMGSYASALMEQLKVPLTTPVPAEWKPAQIPEHAGWKRGTVLFFNLITKSGRIMGEDGIEYYVGYQQLVDVKGPLGILAPMTGVYFRPGEKNPDHQYPSVKSCKPYSSAY